MNPPTAPSITSNSRTGLASSRSPRRHLNRRNVTNATYPSAVVPHPPGASQNIRSAGQGNGVKKTMPRVYCPWGCGTSLRNDNVRRHIISSCPNTTRSRNLICGCGRRLSRKDALRRHQAKCSEKNSTTAVPLPGTSRPSSPNTALPDPVVILLEVASIEDSSSSVQAPGSYHFKKETEVNLPGAPDILLQEVTDLSPPTPWLPQPLNALANLLPLDDIMWHSGTSLPDPLYCVGDEISLFGEPIDYPSEYQLFTEPLASEPPCLESIPTLDCRTTPGQGFSPVLLASGGMPDVSPHPSVEQIFQDFDLYTLPE